MKEDLQILFEQYISGAMTSSEKTTFETRLKSDEGFRREFDLYKEMDGFLDDMEKKGAALGVLREVGEEVKAPKGNDGILWKVALGLLFMILIGLLITIFSREDSVPRSYAEFYVEPTWPIERSDTKDSISMAIAKYLNGDINSATKELRLMQTEDSQYWLAEIYAKEMMHDSVLLYLPSSFKEKVRRDRNNYLRIISNYNLGAQPKVLELLSKLPLDTDKYYTDLYRKLGATE